MKLIIDIPQNIYEMVTNTGTFGCYRFNTTKAIKDGTPLPKGHGRLIDKDKFAKDGYLEHRYGEDIYLEFRRRLDKQPIIIEADRKRSNSDAE